VYAQEIARPRSRSDVRHDRELTTRPGRAQKDKGKAVLHSEYSEVSASIAGASTSVNNNNTYVLGAAGPSNSTHTKDTKYVLGAPGPSNHLKSNKHTLGAAGPSKYLDHTKYAQGVSNGSKESDTPNADYGNGTSRWSVAPTNGWTNDYHSARQ